MTGTPTQRLASARSLRILIAEDEFLVGTILEETLMERGHHIVELCSDYASLERACGTLSFDVAVLDINLAGTMVFPLAERLRATGQAFIFVTGYGAQFLPESLLGITIVPKPCNFDLLEREALRAFEEINTRTNNVSAPQPSSTLGDVLYAKPKSVQSEAEWTGLIQSIAEGEADALLALYDRVHHLVFTLALRICLDQTTAEEITLGVFSDIVQQARRFDADDTTVLGWVMNLTRARALSHARNSTLANDSFEKGVVRPTAALRARVVQQIRARSEAEPPPFQDREPAWEEVAAGIECKLLANDAEKSRISMLVRLAPDGSYPPHTHAGPEELHLLDGELWINENKLSPGDYNFGRPGGEDHRVWSETGCTCVLVTSTRDILHAE